MVGLDGTKMSKSLGNLVFVGDLLKDWDPMVVRLALLGHHYRTDWDWKPADLDTAADRLDRWRAAGSTRGSQRGLQRDLPRGLPRESTRGASRSSTRPAVVDAVRSCLDQDLNVAQALMVLDEEAGAGGDVTDAAELVGVEL
jgi:L-cysteine:1D-myo-inositol 2-amino-2-deoxy-alpha-D-glucopyranoside ligase